MTTVNKSMDIPADRRIQLDLILPPDLPIGKADISVTTTPAPEVSAEPKPRPFAGLAGSLQNSGLFEGDSVEIQRKMRNEW